MTEPTAVDFGHLVIGAGPAGSQPAGHLHEAGRNHRALEAGPAPGAFFATFATPPHRDHRLQAQHRRTGMDDPELDLRRDWTSPAAPVDAVIARGLENRWDEKRTHGAALMAFLEKAVAW